MRSWVVAIGALALSMAGTATAAGLPLAPQQIELCRLHYRYLNDTNAYQRAMQSMNSIQRVSAPPAPSLDDYSIEFAKNGGPSGDFRDWTGTVYFNANAADRSVWLHVSFECPSQNSPGSVPQPGAIGNVINETGPAISAWQKYLAGNGYYGISLDSRMAAAIGQIPNDGRPHYVRFSGHFIYLPSVAGPKAFPSYAKPDAEPNPFNVADMMLLFRITSLTIYR